MEVLVHDCNSQSSSPSPLNMPVVAASPSSLAHSEHEDDDHSHSKQVNLSQLEESSEVDGSVANGMRYSEEKLQSKETEAPSYVVSNLPSTGTFPKKISIKKLSNGTLVTQTCTDSVPSDQYSKTVTIDSSQDFKPESPVSQACLREESTPSRDVQNEEKDKDLSDNVDPALKGRFNLRKRKLMAGSYDGLGSYEVSDEEGQTPPPGSAPYPQRRRRIGQCSEQDHHGSMYRAGPGYSYDMQCLTTALNAIKNGCTIKQASIEYGIPKTSLQRYHQRMLAGYQFQAQSSKEASPEPTNEALSESIASRGLASHGDEVPLKPPKSKICFSMSSIEECQLTAFISLLSRSGKCLSYSDIRVIAEHVVRSSGKSRPKSKSKVSPTSGWVQKFRLRHPELVYKTLDHSFMKLGDPSREDLLNWQNDLESFLKVDWKLDPPTMFSEENASRIYTCDEILIAFSKVGNRGEKVSLKSMLNSTSEEEKQLVTVIAAASASGDYVKPTFLSPRIGVDQSKFLTLDTTSYHAIASSSGLVTPELFMQWMQNFEAHLTSKNIVRPVVLLMDDHAAHFHISVFLYCLDKQIVPVCLPPKLNKLLQPLLGSFFPKLMMAYQACCKRYTAKTGEAISPSCFPYVMMKSWTLVTKPKFVVEGFRSCNLIPMTVTQHVPAVEPSPSSDKNSENGDSRDLSLKVKNESVEQQSEDGESSSIMPDDASLNGDVQVSAKPTLKAVKKRKLSKSSSSSQCSTSGAAHAANSSTPSEVLLGDKMVSEERKTGRREGIDVCLSVLESFVPADILPVWRQRASNHTGTCEIGYCMWKAVQLLSKGGVDMAGRAEPQLLQHSSTQQQ
ncbi:DDE superfamily endonuclease domain [Trinorchestia longiramus]|nr:DDE superfamily endonuclease domain [Trinorchestia longiramus]